MDKSNRYRKPWKREAYEKALELCDEGMTIENMYTDGFRFDLLERMQLFYCDVSYRDIADVTAKAIRVTRFRRKGKNDTLQSGMESAA